MQRLRRVADTRARIRHPNVVRARTVDLVEGRLRLGLEKHSAPTLAERITRGPLDPLEAAHLLEGLADGYHWLAGAGLTVHRFTPDGVLVDPRHGGILADCGVPPELLRRTGPDTDPSQVFCSPEELGGEPVRARSAVYSLGALLYTALTGEPPAGSRPRPTARRPELPGAIDSVVARAMAVDPRDRYATPADLAAAAALALGATPSWEAAGSGPAISEKPPAPRTRRTPERSPRAKAPAAPAKRSGEGQRTRRAGPPTAVDRRQLWVLAATAVIVCSLLGVLLARLSADEAPQPPERIGTRGLSVRPPSGWGRAPAARDSAFPLRALLAARPPAGSEAGMVLGTVPSPAALEPFFAYAGGEDIAREAVRLGPLRAWRYSGLRAGADAATAYVAPTTGGLLVVACHAGGAAGPRLLRQCNRAVGTVAVDGVRSTSLASLDTGGDRLAEVIQTLTARRSRARERLAEADLARGQAKAARALAWSYEAAAAELAQRSPLEPVGSFAGVSASLRRTAAAYARVARAAERSQRLAYQAAVRAVARSERAVMRALVEVRSERL